MKSAKKFGYGASQPYWICTVSLDVLHNQWPQLNLSVALQFPLGMTNHTLKWEGVWRELGCLARSASFAVREESGHSLKSALSVQTEAFFLPPIAWSIIIVIIIIISSSSSIWHHCLSSVDLWDGSFDSGVLLFCLQHTVSIDSRNSAIFPSRGALLRINQVIVRRCLGLI